MKKGCLHFFLLVSVWTFAQGTDQPIPNASNKIVNLSTVNQDLLKHGSKRKWMIGGASIVGYGTSILLFSQAWYKNFARSSFHTFNDGREWLQMDKIGHSWGAYQASRLTTDMWQWAGVPPKNSVLLGTGSSLLFLFSIEYLDGHSAKWGWSWWDATANIFGAGLFAGQELGWKEQRILLKFSSHYKKYQPLSLQQRADGLFGKTFQERLLKDYNAQTYWLSFNCGKLPTVINLPPWLNVAIGYSGSGMFGGFSNLALDANGNIIFDRRDIKRYRQWYLAPDIDLTRIKTKNTFLKSVFSTLNVLKFPAPALEFSNGRFKIKAIAF